MADKPIVIEAYIHEKPLFEVIDPIRQPLDDSLASLKSSLKRRFLYNIQTSYPDTINYKQATTVAIRTSREVLTESAGMLNRKWIELFLIQELTIWWDKKGYSR